MFKWSVLDVEPKRDYTLLLTFSKKKKRIFDCKKIIEEPFFNKLKDIDFFMKAKAEHYTVVWNDDIDIAPEYLYENSSKIK